jgi:hypothetical protein
MFNLFLWTARLKCLQTYFLHAMDEGWRGRAITYAARLNALMVAGPDATSDDLEEELGATISRGLYIAAGDPRPN